MINLKPKIYEALKKITLNVSDTYPQNDWQYPVIIYADEDNTPNTLTAEGERLSNIRFRIEIHTGKSKTTDLMVKVDDAMNQLGFKRTSNIEISGPTGDKIRTIRYELVYDLKTNITYY